jgi:N-acetylgalactosamine-6-sulfatase
MHLVAIGLLAVHAASAFADDAPAKKPNIVFLLADDLGYGDLGCYGCRDIKTPHLDRLAKQGVRFATFYSNGPECSPTRAALLTGRYQQRVGGLECAIGLGNVGRYDDAIRLAKTDDLGLPATHCTLARMLKNAGYATALIGKWHLGYADKFAPQRHGFDHALYCLGGGMDYFHHVEDPPKYSPVLRLNGQPITRGAYFTDLVANEAVRFVQKNRDRPFFLYVPFTAPHSPFQGPGDRLATPLAADSPLWNQSKGPPEVYAAMVERMDQAIGKILAALEDGKLADNTVVIFTSDNGGTRSARPTPFRGFKGSTFEGGVRVPCIVRWPGKLPHNTTTEHVGITMDLTRSITRIAGAQDGAASFDGIDILKGIEKRQPAEPRTLFWRARRGDTTWWAVRHDALKYVAKQDADGKTEHLFDLARDPGEQADLLPRRPDDAARLRTLLAQWEKTVRPIR